MPMMLAPPLASVTSVRSDSNHDYRLRHHFPETFLWFHSYDIGYIGLLFISFSFLKENKIPYPLCNKLLSLATQFANNNQYLGYLFSCQVQKKLTLGHRMHASSGNDRESHVSLIFLFTVFSFYLFSKAAEDLWFMAYFCCQERKFLYWIWHGGYQLAK